MAAVRQPVVFPPVARAGRLELGRLDRRIAILAIAARVSNNSGAAVSLVMVTRVVPGFFLATVGGVIIDKFDRRKVMVSCDIGRRACSSRCRSWRACPDWC